VYKVNRKINIIHKKCICDTGSDL